MNGLDNTATTEVFSWKIKLSVNGRLLPSKSSLKFYFLKWIKSVIKRNLVKRYMVCLSQKIVRYFLDHFDPTRYKVSKKLISAKDFKKLPIWRWKYCRIMQIWDFLHKSYIPICQKFLRHRLQIRTFDEVKIFKYTCCTEEGNTKGQYFL